MRHPVPSRSRRGFTLIELLVVISVIAVLATMVFPAIGLIRRLANEASCGNNLKGLSGAWLAANQDEANPWLKQALYKFNNRSATPTSMASTTSGTTLSYPTSATEAPRFTAAAFECWANVQQLPAKLFKCPSQANTLYTVNSAVTAALSRAESTTWGWSDLGKIPYSFDYCAPSDSASGRVVFADREPSNHSNKTVIVSKADGSTGKLSAVTTAATGAASGGVNSYGYEAEVSTYYVYNPDGRGSESVVGDEADQDVTPDNVYDSSGDFPTGAAATAYYKPGSASTKRTFVK